MHNIIADTVTVVLQRPVSPSSKMTALSRQLSNMGPVNLVLGDSPHARQESALSRKVRSELNLVDPYNAHTALMADILERLDTLQDVPNETLPGSNSLAKDVLECDAIKALDMLGALIARWKGLNASTFVDGLAGLLNSEEIVDAHIVPIVRNNETRNHTVRCYLKERTDDDELKSQARFHQESDEKHQRHFSFEPGDDREGSLETDFESFASLSRTDSTDSGSTPSMKSHLLDEGSRGSGNSRTALLPLIGTETPKPSMIPSPVQTVGRLRRENSVSSLQSVSHRNNENDRHSSLTSVRTVFRSNSSLYVSNESKSRSSSSHDLYTAESPIGSKERLNSFSSGQGTAALAAARAAKARSSNSTRGNTRFSTATSSSRKQRAARQVTAENYDQINPQ